MGLVADFRIKSPEFVLHETVERGPEMDLEMIQQAGTDPGRPYMFVWASGDDFEAFENALTADPTVTDVVRYSTFDDEVLYRMQATDETGLVFYPVWVELGADLMETYNVDGWWHNRMRLPDREALSTLSTWANDNDVRFDLREVYTDEIRRGRDPLTDAQAEVLQVAFERGYFEVPRGCSAEDIAAELDISTQAVSERLRRGHRSLVARHVVDS